MGPFYQSVSSENVKLARNCIVVVLRKIENINKNCNNNVDIKPNDRFEDVRSHSWPDNAKRSISPAALSVQSGPLPYLPLPSTTTTTTPSSKTTITSTTTKCCCNHTSDGWVLFSEFVNENSTCFWSPQLVDNIAQLTFKGFLVPSTLIISGNDDSLEVIRSAWAKRVLKAPHQYEIDFIGDISSIESKSIQKAQFTPLAEALCKCIDEINKKNINATYNVIFERLRTRFSNMILPPANVLKNSMKMLIQQGKISYCPERESFTCSPVYNDNNWDVQTQSSSCTTHEDVHENEKLVYSQSLPYKRSLGIQTNIDSFANGTSLPFTTLNHSSSVTRENENNLTCNNKYSKSVSSPLKRSSSLKLETHKVNGTNETRGFNRSKSLRIQRSKLDALNPSISDTLDSHDVKSKIEPYKKQSMLSKLLRLGTNGKTKANNNKCVNFSSQFPEGDIIKSNETKGTQTIKCGIENQNIAALIIKQASKHALVKYRQNNGDYMLRNNKVCCCFVDQCNNCNCDCIWTCKNSRHTKPTSSTSNKYKRVPQGECYCNICCCNICMNTNYVNDCCGCNRPISYHRESSGSHRCNFQYKDAKQLEYYNYNNNQDIVHQKRIIPSSNHYVTTKPFMLNDSSKLSSAFDKKLSLYNHENDKNSHQYQDEPFTYHQKSLSNCNGINVIEKRKIMSQIEPTISTAAKTAVSSSLSSSLSHNQFIKEKQFNTNIIQEHPLPDSNHVILHPKNTQTANNKFVVDNSVNVKIEIGSSTNINTMTTTSIDDDLATASTSLTTTTETTSENHLYDYNQLSSPTSVMLNSFPIFNNRETKATTQEFPQINKPSFLTSATVTTSMTIPNGTSNINGNGILHYDHVKNIGSNNQQENNTNTVMQQPINKIGMNKQNCKYKNQIQIDSIPHLSPIRQKVAKAKAEFFNSACPQSILTNNNLLESRVNS